MSIISIQRDTNNNISIVRMQVSDTLGAVGATDYIADNQEAINILNGGTWAWFITDMILVAASDGNGFFEFVDEEFATVVIFGQKGGGTINPGLENNLPYYVANGDALSPLSNLANAILATNGSEVPALTTTLPTAVQDNITSLGTVVLGVWNGTPVTVPFGGSGLATLTAFALMAGGTTATGNMQQVSGVGTSGQVLTSNGAGALPTWQTNAASGTVNPGLANQIAYYASSGTAVSPISTVANSVFVTSGLGVPSWSNTLPSGLTIPGYQTTITPAALTRVDDTNVTLTLGGSPTTALIAATSLTLGWTGQLGLTRGGTNASLTASNGGIVYSTATALAILSGTATANLPLLSGSSAAPSWGAFALSLGGALTTAGALTTVGAFAATFTFTGATNVTFPTSGTLATTGGSVATLTGDSGTATASAGNINVVGTGSGLTFTGASATLTLGGTLNVSHGGLGLTSITAHNLIIGNGTTAATLLAPSATSGVALISQGASADPAYGTVVVAGGGTGLTSITAHNLLIGNGTSAATLLAPGATSGVALISQGASADPAYGTVVVAGGGTGLTSITAHNLLIGNGTSAATLLAPSATSGVPLISQGASADPAYGTAVVAGGGTGNTTFTAYSVICAGTTATGAFQNVSGVGTSGQVLTSQGAGALPAWSSVPSALTGRLINIQVFTTSGDNTYTPTANVTTALVELWGGGGGGGSTNSSTTFGCGGGGGAFASSFVAVTGAVTIHVGAAGTGGVKNNGTAGTDGGDTTYNSTTIVAKGGVHSGNGSGTPGAGGAAASCTGQIKLSGTKGGNNPAAASPFLQAGGMAPRSVQPAISPSFGDVPPANSGAGGCAGNSLNDGGNGAAGLAIVYEFS